MSESLLPPENTEPFPLPPGTPPLPAEFQTQSPPNSNVEQTRANTPSQGDTSGFNEVAATDPTTPEGDNNDIEATEITDSTSVIAGIRRFIAERRLHRTSKKLRKATSSDYVIKEAPAGATVSRSFKSSPEREEVKPVRMVERITSLHRQGQVKRIRRKQVRLRQLNDNYQTKATPQETPIELMHFSSPDAKRREMKRQKIAKLDAPFESSLGSREHFDSIVNGRNRPYQRRAQLREIREARRIEKYIARREERLERGTQGETVPARRRQRKITKLETRQEKLRKKLRELRE